MRLYSQRRGSIRAVCVSCDQAMRLFLLSRAPSTCFAVDQTTDDLPSARHARRPCQREIRTDRGKRPLTTTTYHPEPASQATSIPEDGPASPGAPGQDGSDLETSAFPRPAGDAPALAS